MTFEAFILEAKNHYRLVPLVEIIEEDPDELNRLKKYFLARGKDQSITDLYDTLEHLEDDTPIALMPNPNHKQLSLL